MSKKILIIDDEPTQIEPVIDRIEFTFGPDSFIYTQYFDEGLLALEKENISCLSIDLIMPADGALKYKDSLINGINALKQIREEHQGLPIVCYTVVKEEETIQKIINYHSEYISKKDDDGFYKLFKFFNTNFKRQ